MRHIEDVARRYNISKQKGRKKIQIIEWFQKHPGKRFDVSEIYAALGDDLDVGEGQIRNYLKELADEDVLKTFGENRIAYQLEDDIVVPFRYQARAVMVHLTALFDINRWGVAGVFTIVTALWAVLTFPFWFLWGTLIISPSRGYGPIAQSEFLFLAISMTFWLIVFVLLTTGLHRIHRWYRAQGSDVVKGSGT